MIVIPVFSDTHGFKETIKKCGEIAMGYDFFFHLGDNIKDALEIEGFCGKQGFKVVGNTDIGAKGDEKILLTIKGKRILLCHGHQFGVKSGLTRLSYYCEENGIDLAVFGHTHVSLITEINGVKYFNPGSAVLPRGGTIRSYGLISISDEGIWLEIKSL
ncbi:hypothetical protein SAMN02745227_01368 [Anaerobranca californiensis DSM 14826]|uniref:Phosphoesterase n=1 Tax=Anaerobranca californiensis DSM 14826 TaxID=1120989 RepID=A0A1M6P839_9FIRM|nr:metallophosphoesterase [Anaerobranca californiensis]SHK04108.1 hypothetical protein SAMN02745227_01368 [Anaerobranca californiensis DSM 14826]